jgi:hypothetical protein
LKSAGRIAEEKGMHELEELIAHAVSIAEQEEER